MQRTQDPAFKAGDGSHRRDDGVLHAHVVVHQPGSHFQGRGDIHMVGDQIDTAFAHRKHRVVRADGDLRGEELGVGQQFVVGHVGNFDPVKNHAFLIDVLECACRKERSCTLLLAGSGNNALQRNIKEKVRRMGLESNVRFLGKRTDIDELLNAFDVFVFPSLHEGLGIVALEAQANGLQCVLSDTLPPEVAVTDNIAFVSLKKPAGYWADLILSYKNNYIRTNMQECIANAGYDINNVAEWLSAFYLDLQDKAGK